jgi:hypothetical protein
MCELHQRCTNLRRVLSTTCNYAVRSSCGVLVDGQMAVAGNSSRRPVFLLRVVVVNNGRGRTNSSFTTASAPRKIMHTKSIAAILQHVYSIREHAAHVADSQNSTPTHPIPQAKCALRTHNRAWSAQANVRFVHTAHYIFFAGCRDVVQADDPPLVRKKFTHKQNNKNGKHDGQTKL